MKWFKFEPQEEEISETESSSMLVYLSPEALKHAVIVDDFASFQDSPECIPGGRLFEVSRQYSYRLRQVADLVEEPLDDQKLQMKTQPKRNFHEEIRPEKRLDNQIEDLLTDNSNIADQSTTQLEETDESVEAGQTQQKLRPEQVPFKDLESLFVK
ncbi:uncharacterized protein METZ01_LOCUS45673 [marine metagenome]|uniref:Uncharacterized protein n=1 Tax=marine metagenome TaxID=408172 RepID=A0A381RP43_9ZZZZ